MAGEGFMDKFGRNRRWAQERSCKDFTGASTNQHMKKLSAFLLAVGFSFGVFAQTKTLLNLDKSGVAIQGYDPIAFFSDHHPMMGKPEFTSHADGATYYFASKEHKALFDKDPMKYEPCFGGYCAYGVSHNKLAHVDVEAFQIVDGKLYMQYSKSVRDSFNEDQKGNLGKANQNWPSLLEKKGM
jgi:YHS domain-containing protein